MKRIFLASGLCLSFAALPAMAAAPVLRDQLTVSGRFDVAKASAAPLKGGLILSEVSVDPGVLSALGGKPEQMTATVRQSIEASLRNFGYLGDAGAPVRATIEPLEVTKDKDATTAVVRIAFKAGGDSEAARCVPATAEASFKALRPIHTSAANGERAAGVVAVIAFAAIGYNAGQQLSAQLASANAQDRAFNAQRMVGKGEGVAASGKDSEMLQFAVMNATQLAMADFIRQLGASHCAQSATTAPPAQPAMAASEAPPVTARPTAPTS